MLRHGFGLLLVGALLAILGFGCAPAQPARAPAAPTAAPAAAAPAAPAAGAPAAASAPSASPAAAAAPRERAKVTFGGLGGTVDRALYVALEKGFLDEQALDLEVEPFVSAADMVPHLATGKLDAGHGSTSPGFFNAILAGVPVRVVSDVTVLRDTSAGLRNSLMVVVRKDLADQIPTLAELKGRTFAINNRGTMNHGQLAKLLTDHGLTLDDIRLESIPFPDQMAALSNGAIDAVITLEPFITLSELRNIGVPIYDLGTGFPDYPVQYLFYGPEFIQSRNDVGRRLAVAYMKALRYIEDAFRKNQNRDEVIQIFIKHTPVKEAALWERMAVSYSETNGNVNTRAINTDQEFYVRQGFQRTRVDTATLVDLSFSENAVRILGRYID